MKVFIESTTSTERSTKFVERVVSKNATCSYKGKTYRVKTYATGEPDLFLLVDRPIKATIKSRLDYLRSEIEAERISMDEIIELQSLADHIRDDDVLLLEWAGVEE